MFGQAEEQVRASVEWLRLLVETLGALAIAVIRTALNYFLSRELKDEQASEEPALNGQSR